MSDLKVTDMYIWPTACKYVTGNKKAGKKGIDAFKGKPAIPVELDAEGKILKKAIPAIKEEKAKPAIKGSQEMWVWADNSKILKELEARMAAEGLFPVEGEELIDKLKVNYVFRGFDVSKKIGQCYSAETRTPFQDAFKKAKSKDFYNKVGAAVLKADKLEKNRKKDAIKREAEKVRKEKAVELKKKEDNKEVKKKKKLSLKTKKSEKKDGDDWPA